MLIGRTNASGQSKDNSLQNNSVWAPGSMDPGVLEKFLEAEFERWCGSQPCDLPGLAAEHLARLGIPARDPLALACIAGAEATMRWGGLAYHGAAHHAEVALSAMMLASVAEHAGLGIDPRLTAVLLLACLVHDLGYRPPGNQGVAFLQEKRAAEKADEIMEWFGVSWTERQVAKTLILATEPMYRPSLRKVGEPLPLADLPAELEPVDRVPWLSELAKLISDADLLASAGLSVAQYRVHSERLSRELGCLPHELADAPFLDGIVGPGFLSRAGRQFDANLLRIKAEVLPAAN